MDAGILDPAEDYSAIPESYVIFITENDVLKGAKPIYHIERCVLETGTPFNDGAHIVYVNSQIQDETALGRLMQDFYRTSADEMNYQLLADRVKYFKEDMKGVGRMCEAVEKLCNEARLEGKVETTLKFIKSAMSQLKMTASEAMKLAGVEPNEQKIYLDMLAAE